jgi:hypothetical protein
VAVANHYNNSLIHSDNEVANRHIPSVTQTFHGIGVDVENLKAEVERLLDLHDMFVREFLRGIAIRYGGVDRRNKSMLRRNAKIL